MNLLADVLQPALRDVLYDEDDLTEAFVLKVDALAEDGLGMAFARFCLTRINSFPKPLRQSLFLSVPRTSLNKAQIAELVRPSIDGRYWREAMRILTDLGIDREHWFQSLDSVPPPMRQEFQSKREGRLRSFDKAEASR